MVLEYFHVQAFYVGSGERLVAISRPGARSARLLLEYHLMVMTPSAGQWGVSRVCDCGVLDEA